MESGIIPAYAGNTANSRTMSRFVWDHPRVCGEHKYGLPVRLPVPGSSPRMRGTQIRESSGTVGHGIIPAYAGNTSPDYQSYTIGGDHPRVCGEHTERLA